MHHIQYYRMSLALLVLVLSILIPFHHHLIPITRREFQFSQYYFNSMGSHLNHRPYRSFAGYYQFILFYLSCIAL